MAFYSRFAKWGQNEVIVFMKLDIFKKIRNFLVTHYELQVIPVITKHIREAFSPDDSYFLIDDVRRLGGIKNTNPHQLVICVPLLNDFSKINQSLIKIHNSVRQGGIFIGRAETLWQRKQVISERCNKLCCNIIMIYEFIFKRALPKLLGFRSIYRKFRIIKHRMLSKCEILGRLQYCGFEILEFKETERYLYFITRKNTQFLKAKPRAGILIKIPKVGKDGHDIYCYKFRTMHPYADCLHDYILNNCHVDNEGKVIGDFRKTGWGKFLRKTWLDEMPQLYNILKGDLSFIGLRPLTNEFLSLYPKDWRKKRMTIKSGFIPPYYADCPKTFEEIIASEKRYYERKMRHPLTTDIFYFVSVVLSFLCMRARTG